MLSLALWLAAFAAADSPLTITPPPGWTDVTPRGKNGPWLMLTGPQTSSLTILEGPALPESNRAAARAYLHGLLAAMEKQTGLDFGPPGPMLTETYGNGLKLDFVRADFKGKPRLVLALGELSGKKMQATLLSAVPDTLMESLFGAVRVPAPGAPRAGPTASSDGQLLFTLEEGVAARPLTESERKNAFVLALTGLGAELLILKVVEQDAKAADQPQIVAQTVLSYPGVETQTASPVEALATPAGPALIYSTARLRGEGRFVAGYLPWGYHGYSVLAKGARSSELVKRVFGRLALGPSALPKVVAASPEIPIKGKLRIETIKLLIGATAAGLIGLVAVILLRRR